MLDFIYELCGKEGLSLQAASSEAHTNCSEHVLNLGARAGLQAACNRQTKQAQVQALLEVFNSYAYPESVKVLLLYVSYQAGRKNIDNNTAARIISDVLDIVRKCGSSGESVQELVRKYLGALKWVYTSVSRSASHVCRESRRIMREPIDRMVETIAEHLARAMSAYGRRGW